VDCCGNVDTRRCAADKAEVQRTNTLPSYLRTYRKSADLSQNEVALLLGFDGGTKVSRYERFRRHPSLETVGAYEAVLRRAAGPGTVRLPCHGIVPPLRRRSLRIGAASESEPAVCSSA
jgi:transcriptional regulator with XRE-family HTH domain